ncbi:MAG TPA: sugar ABC transporter substrate-binding protein [Trebonia sp.]|jgi:simple sugar transport system substrate-binding protein/ribose transport system substrate-binding protein|nr:sugar ABC transporter substrate-binding protein [Trebonia sp.]
MRFHRRLFGTVALAAAGLLVAACGSSSSGSGASTASGSTSGSSSGQVTIGVDLTYNNTAFWAAYINYEQQYAQQMHIKLLGPLLASASASLQNQQIENLVDEGAKAIIVNPETATSLAPAISYATAHHVQLVSVDTIVGVGHVYIVVRASNTLYGQDACAYISSKVKSGYVLDLEGDLTSSNGIDRTNAFDSCMAANDPGVKLLKDPTVWTDATGVTDAQNAINAYGSNLKAIYSQWSSPDTGIIPLLKSKNLTNTIVVSDDGVPFEMCDIGNGTVSASQSQPANLYAQYALTYAKDAADGVTLKAGQPGGGAPELQNEPFDGDSNLVDPIVAPFVTKVATALSVATPVDGLPASFTTTPVSDASLWGNVYGAAHGGVCASSASS